MWAGGLAELGDALRPERLDPLVVPVGRLPAVVDHRQAAVVVAQRDDDRVEVAGGTDGRVDPNRALRVHLDDLAAGDVAGHVEVVHGHVEEDPAGHLDVADRRRGGVAAGDPHEVDRADHATGDGVAHRAVGRIEPAVEPDLQPGAGGGDGGEGPVDLGQVEGDRLLAEDRLAGAGGGDEQVDMGVGARADRDRVELGRAEQFLGRRRRRERPARPPRAWPGRRRRRRPSRASPPAPGGRAGGRASSRCGRRRAPRRTTELRSPSSIQPRARRLPRLCPPRRRCRSRSSASAGWVASTCRRWTVSPRSTWSPSPSRRPDAMDAAATLRPAATRYADVGDALAHPGLEACIVATPTPTHPDVVEAALAAGLHVLCEKPLSLDAARGDDLGAIAARARPRAADRVLAALLAAVADGQARTSTGTRSGRPSCSGWRSGTATRPRRRSATPR